MPLIGVRGCINYNPVLAQRQFGYPIRGAPTADALVALVCYYKEGFMNETLHRIRNAWKDLFYAKKDTRLWSVNKGVPYQQWLAERVREVKLPYHAIPQEPLGESVPEEPVLDARSEEIQKLKEENEWLKRKNNVLKDDIQSLQHDYLNVKVECEEKTKANESLVKRQKVDKQCIVEMTQKLIEVESTPRVREWEGVASSEYQWKMAYEEASWNKRMLTRELHDLQTKFDNIEAQMKDIVEEYEGKIKSEQWYRTEMEEKHEVMVTQLQNHIAEQDEAIIHWKRCFSQLVALANGAIDEVPRMWREADATLKFFNLLEKVQDFLNHCKYLVEEMKSIVARAKK